MSGIREFLNSTPGKITGAIVGAAVVLLLIWSIKANLGSEAESLAKSRMYIDAETGKNFRHTLSLGEITPVKAPSGKTSGYPAEACYWTKDGSTKKEPTWVLLNVYMKKSGPTFCPDCGRLVVGHNPAPAAGEKAPPTADEYAARNTDRDVER